MYKKETQVDIEEMDILIAFHKHNLAEDDALKAIMQTAQATLNQ